jgi:hypothetical protein
MRTSFSRIRPNTDFKAQDNRLLRKLIFTGRVDVPLTVLEYPEFAPVCQGIGLSTRNVPYPFLNGQPDDALKSDWRLPVPLMIDIGDPFRMNVFSANLPQIEANIQSIVECELMESASLESQLLPYFVVWRHDWTNGQAIFNSREIATIPKGREFIPVWSFGFVIQMVEEGRSLLVYLDNDPADLVNIYGRNTDILTDGEVPQLSIFPSYRLRYWTEACPMKQDIISEISLERLTTPEYPRFIYQVICGILAPQGTGANTYYNQAAFSALPKL